MMEKKQGIRYIEICGMIAGGKNTAIDAINQRVPDGIVATKEAYTSLKKWGKFHGRSGSEEQGYIVAATIAELINAALKLKCSGNAGQGVIIANRGFIDLPVFARARLLYGDFPLSYFLNHYFLESYKTKGTADSTIVFMQRPFTSLERREQTKHNNPEFLDVLYEQYLRMIAELEDVGQKNLFVLDSSGTKENSFRLLSEALSKITGMEITSGEP